MDYRELKRLARESSAAPAQYRLAVLGDCATQHIAAAVQGALYAKGVTAHVFDADYDQILAQVIDPDSELYAFKPNAVLFCLCAERLQETYAALPPEKRATLAEDTCRRSVKLWQTASEGLPGAAVLQLNYPLLDDGVFGSFAAKLPLSFLSQERKLNCLLCEAAAAEKNVYIVDIDAVLLKYYHLDQKNRQAA